MEPIEITTPSNYKVSLKPYLNYGQSTQIREIYTANLKVKIQAPNSGVPTEAQKEAVKQQLEDIEVSTETIFLARKKTLEFLLLKVIMPDGQESNNALAAIDEMPEIDGDFVMDEVDKISSHAEITQKKIVK